MVVDRGMPATGRKGHKMARTVQLPPGAEQEIARQIGRRIPPGAFVESSLHLGTSLPVALVPLDRIKATAPGTGLETVTRTTSGWYHQVLDSLKRPFYARSSERPSGQFVVEELAQSALADGISNTISFVDQEFGDDSEVVLLSAPAFLLTAFQIRSPKGAFVVIADRPSNYKDLPENVVLTEHDFVTRLRDAEPIRAVGRKSGLEQGE
jgi:hypothetical protein